MDIRQNLQALSPDDRAIWSDCRSNMRKAYLYAHNQAIGLQQWSMEDDAFCDLIDIRLALLFDRGGKLNAANDIIHKEDGNKTIEQIESDGTKLMKSNSWEDK